MLIPSAVIALICTVFPYVDAVICWLCLLGAGMLHYRPVSLSDVLATGEGSGHVISRLLLSCVRVASVVA